MTRDAELYIEDEYNGDLQSKILSGIKKRNTGIPSRFLFDEKVPDRPAMNLVAVYARHVLHRVGTAPPVEVAASLVTLEARGF